MDLARFPLGQKLCDVAEQCFARATQITLWGDFGDPTPGIWCNSAAEGAWRDSPKIVLVAEVYSLTLVGRHSPFGKFPTARVDDDSGISGDYEPSDMREYIESDYWYLDDAPADDREPQCLVAGHALIRFATAVGCVFDSAEMIDELGFFYPDRIGLAGLEAPLSASINETIDDGPHSRLYQELIREAARTNLTTRTFLELYDDFSGLFNWYSGWLDRADRRAKQINEAVQDRMLNIYCPPESSVDDELPF